MWGRYEFFYGCDSPGGRVFYSSGWRQRRSGKRPWSRSVVIHSLPDSMASAAK